MRRATLRRACGRYGPGALATLLVLLACRDRPEPFEAVRRPPRGDPPGRLTFNPGNDRGPIWSPDGDSVYYAADGFDHLPRIRGVLARVPRQGGVAELVFSDVQDPTAPRRRLVALARSPDAQRIVYSEFWRTHEEEGGKGGCDLGWVCTSPDTTFSIPPLETIMCRVRAAGATGRVEDDPALRVDLPGWSIVDDGIRPPLEVLVSHPFQYVYNTEGALVFRPSWSPDGERVALSDGVRLLVWRVGEAQAVEIPGTADGVGPAWSPDGEWIAYTHLERGGSRTFSCTCPGAFGQPSRRHERTIFEVLSRTVRLVRPDGSEQIELVEGEEPAWTPDGSAIVFRAQDQLWRIGRDGSGLAAIPGTQAGREPAVSPDGRFLAYARRNPNGTHDIWVISFEQP